MGCADLRAELGGADLGGADLVIETSASPAALPPEARALLDEAGLFLGTAWWEVVLRHALPAGAEGLFVTVRSSGRVVAVVPLLRTGRRMESLTTPYTCVYRPVLAAGMDRSGRTAVMAAFAGFARRARVLRLDALPAEWEGHADLQAGARTAGLVPMRFDHFGNWYEDVGGANWAGYLAARPGALRETIRRRLRRAEKLTDARFTVYTRPDQLVEAGAMFESVYARSWKETEPFPSFNVALMRAMAAGSRLRLGVWSIGAQPVAVQFWAVEAGCAVVLKLAHDEAFKVHSPGTVLTALMLRHLLEQEQVVQIDFGRGDDAYKQGWAKQRRQRVGLLLADPFTGAGVAAIARHRVGTLRRRWGVGQGVQTAGGDE